jgi:hypothetical protein
MHEPYLQIRIDEIHAEMLRDAAARRLVRESRLASERDSITNRARRAIARAFGDQRSASTAPATSRTPSSISDVATAP